MKNEFVRYKDGLSYRTHNRRISVFETPKGLFLQIVRTFKDGEYNDEIKDTPHQFILRKAGKKLLVSKMMFSKEGLSDISALLFHYFNESTITYTWNPDNEKK